MKNISRRESLRFLTLAGMATSTMLTGCETDAPAGEEHSEHVHEDIDGLYGLSEEDKLLLQQEFFTEHERETVRVLANLTIPADDRSGNAEEAGTVEFIEFMMLDAPPLWRLPLRLRGGLRWLDVECLSRHNQPFIGCSDAQQTALLDLIAYPDTAPPEVSQGVAFFNLFRNMVATGFWTSKMGMEDLQYMGNKPTVWDGAPQEWLDRLGVSYG